MHLIQLLRKIVFTYLAVASAQYSKAAAVTIPRKSLEFGVRQGQNEFFTNSDLIHFDFLTLSQK